MGKIKSKDKMIEKLQCTVDAEITTFNCYRYLASLIKNGRVRNRFHSFSDETNRNKELLISRLEARGITDFVPENKCKFCRVKPESFSLIGAVELGLEVTAAASKFYRDLTKLSDNPEDRNVFKILLRQRNKQRYFLKKEKEFLRFREHSHDFIKSYCIPEVISKLWK